jgi:hypothetical protein
MQYRESHTALTDLPAPPSIEAAQPDEGDLMNRLAQFAALGGLTRVEAELGVEWCSECEAYHALEESATARQTRMSGGGAPLSAVTGSAHSASLTSMGPGTM